MGALGARVTLSRLASNHAPMLTSLQSTSSFSLYRPMPGSPRAKRAEVDGWLSSTRLEDLDPLLVLVSPV